VRKIRGGGNYASKYGNTQASRPNLRDFSLLLWRCWGLRSSGMLRCIGWLLVVTAFSPIFQGQEVQEDPWKWDWEAVPKRL